MRFRAEDEEWGSDDFDVVGGNHGSDRPTKHVFCWHASRRQYNGASTLDKNTQVVDLRIGKDELAGRSR